MERDKKLSRQMITQRRHRSKSVRALDRRRAECAVISRMTGETASGQIRKHSYYNNKQQRKTRKSKNFYNQTSIVSEKRPRPNE